MAMTGYFKTEKNPIPPFVKGWLWLETTIEEATGTNTQINIGDVFKAIATMKIVMDDGGKTWKVQVGEKINKADTWKDIF